MDKVIPANIAKLPELVSGVPVAARGRGRTIFMLRCYASGSVSRSCLRRSASFSHEYAIHSKIFLSTGVAAEFASSRHLTACVLYSATMCMNTPDTSLLHQFKNCAKIPAIARCLPRSAAPHDLRGGAQLDKSKVAQRCCSEDRGTNFVSLLRPHGPKSETCRLEPQAVNRFRRHNSDDASYITQ